MLWGVRLGCILTADRVHQRGREGVLEVLQGRPDRDVILALEPWIRWSRFHRIPGSEQQETLDSVVDCGNGLDLSGVV